MNQPTLFDPPVESPPLYRVTDPASSKAAAGRMQRSGRIAGNAMIALRLLAGHNGSTSVELFEAQGDKKLLDRHEISRRLSTLEAKGLATKGPVRCCKVKGTEMVEWLLTAAGEAEAVR